MPVSINTKALECKIRANLMPLAWYPDRVVDWCFDKDEKRDLKQLWVNLIEFSNFDCFEICLKSKLLLEIKSINKEISG